MPTCSCPADFSMHFIVVFPLFQFSKWTPACPHFRVVFAMDFVLSVCMPVTCVQWWRRRPAHTLPLQVLGTAAEWCFAVSCYFRLLCTTLVFIVLKRNLLWSNKIVVVNKFICRTMSVDILARALSIDSGLSRVWSNVGFKLLPLSCLPLVLLCCHCLRRTEVCNEFHFSC
jgi:hypothetical protein